MKLDINKALSAYKAQLQKTLNYTRKFGTQAKEFNEIQLKMNIIAQRNVYLEKGQNPPSYTKLAQEVARKQVYKYSNSQVINWMTVLKENTNEKITKTQLKAKGLEGTKFAEDQKTLNNMLKLAGVGSAARALAIAQTFYGSE